MPRTIALASNTAWYLHNFRGGLIRDLLARGDRVVTLSPPDRYVPRLRDLGCEVVDLPMDNMGTNPFRDIATWHRFRRAYRAIGPDVVLHYTAKPMVYGSLAARSMGIPIVNTVTGLGTAFLRGGPLQAVVQTLYRVALRHSPRVFFQNPDDLDLFVSRGLVRSEQAGRLPGSGVDLDRFAVAPIAQGPARVFLLVARMLRDKGIGELVEAARSLRRESPSLRFQLLGQLGAANRTAISRSEVEGWVREGVIEYLGETDDVRPWIAQADCVVLPSYREGTPRTLLEAAAMGRPVVTTDVPGCRQVVEDGVTGLLCRARDATDLAVKIRSIMGMTSVQRHAMGLAGRAKMEREFDQRLVIEGYLGAIDEALRGREAKMPPASRPPGEIKPLDEGASAGPSTQCAVQPRAHPSRSCSGGATADA